MAHDYGVRHHHENDVTMTIAGLWMAIGDVATGCTTLVKLYYDSMCACMCFSLQKNDFFCNYCIFVVILFTAVLAHQLFLLVL